MAKEGTRPALVRHIWDVSLHEAIGRQGVELESVTEAVKCVPGDTVEVQEKVPSGARRIVRDR